MSIKSCSPPAFTEEGYVQGEPDEDAESHLRRTARGFMNAVNRRELDPMAECWSAMAPGYFGVSKVGTYLDSSSEKGGADGGNDSSSGNKVSLPMYLSMVARAVVERPSFRLEERDVSVVIMDGKSGRKKRARVFLSCKALNGRAEGIVTETMIVYEFVKRREKEEVEERWWCIRSTGLSALGGDGSL